MRLKLRPTSRKENWFELLMSRNRGAHKRISNAKRFILLECFYFSFAFFFKFDSTSENVKLMIRLHQIWDTLAWYLWLLHSRLLVRLPRLELVNLQKRQFNCVISSVVRICCVKTLAKKARKEWNSKSWAWVEWQSINKVIRLWSQNESGGKKFLNHSISERLKAFLTKQSLKGNNISSVDSTQRLCVGCEHTDAWRWH